MAEPRVTAVVWEDQVGAFCRRVYVSGDDTAFVVFDGVGSAGLVVSLSDSAGEPQVHAKAWHRRSHSRGLDRRQEIMPQATADGLMVIYAGQGRERLFESLMGFLRV